jgi:hypothetical protein
LGCDAHPSLIFSCTWCHDQGFICQLVAVQLQCAFFTGHVVLAAVHQLFYLPWLWEWSCNGMVHDSLVILCSHFLSASLHGHLGGHIHLLLSNCDAKNLGFIVKTVSILLPCNCFTLLLLENLHPLL